MADQVLVIDQVLRRSENADKKVIKMSCMVQPGDVGGEKGGVKCAVFLRADVANTSLQLGGENVKMAAGAKDFSAGRG